MALGKNEFFRVTTFWEYDKPFHEGTDPVLHRTSFRDFKDFKTMKEARAYARTQNQGKRGVTNRYGANDERGGHAFTVRVSLKKIRLEMPVATPYMRGIFS